MPSLDSEDKNKDDSGYPSTSNTKKKGEFNGNFKILMVYRNSRADLRIWPSNQLLMKSFTN
jgi:hypothetical protein